MLEIVRDVAPEFVKVTVCTELVDKTFVDAKVNVVGEMEAVGPPDVPVPLRLTVCGLPAALSETEIVAERVPAAVGLKVTLIVQLAPFATEVPQLFVCEKSAAFVPVIVILEIVSVPLPVLNNVTPLTGLEVPTAWLGNVRFEVLKLTPEDIPVPVRAAVCGLPDALSLMDTLACRVPAATGVNVTLIVQLVATARELPQLFV